MKNVTSSLRTLEFQGQPIYYLATPEGNMVLIRPICDILGLKADHQVEAIKDDEMLGAGHRVHGVQLPGDTQSRLHFCLLEKYIYGWLFEVKATNTMKPETKANLTAYKRECYDTLFDHFHGKIKQALELDKAVAVVQVQLTEVNERLRQKLENDPDQLLKEQLERERKELTKAKTKNSQQSQQIALEYALALQAPEQPPA